MRSSGLGSGCGVIPIDQLLSIANDDSVSEVQNVVPLVVTSAAKCKYWLTYVYSNVRCSPSPGVLHVTDSSKWICKPHFCYPADRAHEVLTWQPGRGSWSRLACGGRLAWQLDAEPARRDDQKDDQCAEQYDDLATSKMNGWDGVEVNKIVESTTGTT